MHLELNTHYKFRYFFDAGSGVCLWSGNAAARKRFGYAVQTDELFTNASLLTEAARLIDWFDQSIQWADPGSGSLWTQGEEVSFQKAALDLHGLLTSQCGANVEIINFTKSRL
jgi:hypothetical protein